MGNNKYRESDTKRFVNPYTFVSIDRIGPEKTDIETAERGSHTGVMECRLMLRTPLIIPDTKDRKEDKQVSEHYIYPFMKNQEGKYMIPGSSLRGPVRSVYETLTNSCLSTMAEEKAITARTKKPFKPGILHNKGGKFSLSKAERNVFRVEEYSAPRKEKQGIKRIKEKDLRKFEYGEEVFFRKLPEKKGQSRRGRSKGNFVKDFRRKAGGKKADGEYEGFLYIGENMTSQKHYESIFREKEESVLVDSKALEAAYIKLKETLEIYRDPKINQKLERNGQTHTGYRNLDLKKFERGESEGLPVWFHQTKGRVYLSFASIGRFGYENTISSIEKEHVPCSNRKSRCKACALFGMVERDRSGKGGAAGLVRFSDAVYEGNETTVRLTLEELSGPKVSYLPFYAKTGDYVAGYDADDVRIRGRKFYWHHMPELKNAAEKNNRNATMEYLKSGVFRFKVYYDGISDRQFDELKWLLCLGENIESGRYCFKIGHGKPLGFGSCKIIIDSVKERKFDGENYRMDEKTSDEIIQMMKKSPFPECRELMKVMDLDSIKGKWVHYPAVTDSIGNTHYNKAGYESFQWFGWNFKLGDKKPKHIMKSSLEDDQSLPAAERISKKADKKKRSDNTKNVPWKQNKGRHRR